MSFTPGRGGEGAQDCVLSSGYSYDSQAAVPESKMCKRLTWPEGLRVSDSNQTGVVNFSLSEQTNDKTIS